MYRLFLKGKNILKIFRYLYFQFSPVIIVNGFFEYEKGQLVNNNLGDDINIPLLSALTGKRIVTLESTGLTFIPHLLCIGSVVGRMNKASLIWGSGALYGNQILKCKPRKIFAVRGHYTRSFLLEQGIECPEVYGDPALLLPLIYKPNFSKKYKIGIIPHYTEYELSHVVEYRNAHPEVLFIKMRGYYNWKDVIDQIASCESVVSSSLHGLIIADAYGIENVWAKFSKELEGGDFKFLDYFSGVKRPFQKPLDFSIDIDIKQAISILPNYTHIEFNPQKLIEVFPYKLSSKLLKDVCLEKKALRMNICNINP